MRIAVLATATLVAAATSSWPMGGYNAQHTSRISGVNGAHGPGIHQAWGISGISSEAPASMAVTADGVVFLALYHAIYYATSGQVWPCWTMNAFAAPPALSNDGVTLFAANSNGTLYAVNASSCNSLPGGGTQRWQFQADGAITSSPTLVSNGVILLGCSSGSVYAVNGTSGIALWKHNIAAGAAVVGSPAMSVHSTVVFAGSTNSLVAMSAHTGAMIWKYHASIASSPVVTAKLVYVTVTTGGVTQSVHALYAANGVLVWQATTAGPLFATPALSLGDLVVIGSADGAGTVQVFDGATGTQLGNTTVGSPIHCTASIDAAGIAYVGNENGFVSAINTTVVPRDDVPIALQILWMYKMYSPVRTAPAMYTNGSVIAQSLGTSIGMNFVASIAS